MAKNVIFNIAAAAILDFTGNQYCQQIQLRDLILGLCLQFGANPFKNGRVMAV